MSTGPHSAKQTRLPTSGPAETPISARAVRSQERKRQLADCAATLFLERGYAGVSVTDIARAAGVTGPALYRHFADKQALLAAAVLRGIEDLEACTESALTDDATPRDLIDVLCAVAVSRPATAVLWRANSVFLSDEQNHEIAQRTKALLRLWGTALRGPQRPGSRTIAWSILSVVGSVSVHHTRLSSTRARRQIRSVIIRLISLSLDDRPQQWFPAQQYPESQTRRDEILDAAADLFLTKGFAGVGIDDIGAAVGISGPSVYNHFDSKLAIVAAIGQRSGVRLESDAAAILDTGARPTELLSALVDSYVHNLTDTPDLSVSFDSTHLLADDRETARQLLTVQRTYVKRWIGMLARVDADLDAAEAALQVHAALSIANDAVRMGRNRNRANFPAELAYLMKGALGILSS